MKNIRFVLAILFAGFLAVSLTTCGGSSGGGSGIPPSGTTGVEPFIEGSKFSEAQETENVTLEDGKVVEAAKDEVLAFAKEDITPQELDAIKIAINRLGGTIVGSSTEIRTIQIRIPSTAKETDFIAQLKSLSGVDSAGLNLVVKFTHDNFSGYNRFLQRIKTYGVKALSKVIEKEVTYPAFDGDYWIKHIGANQAWDITTGSQANDAIIGIVDTGINKEQKIMESGRLERFDENGNHLEDDDTKEAENGHHGRWVTGFAAGYMDETDNKVRGIAWKNKVIMIDVGKLNEECKVEVFGIKLFCTKKPFISNTLAGIKTAISRGSKILNVSIGQGTCSDPHEIRIRDLQNFREVMTPAVNMAKRNDCLVIFAAGNENEKRDDQLLPSGSRFEPDSWLTYVLRVSATDIDKRDVSNWSGCQGSNMGAAADIAAPGDNIAFRVGSGWLGWLEGLLGMSKGSGTSYAAPLVTGTAALVKSMNLTLAAPEIRYILLDSADRSVQFSEEAIKQEATGPKLLLNSKKAVDNAKLTTGISLIPISEIQLLKGETKDVSLPVTVPAASVSGLDVLFLIDTTGSYYDDIDTLQAKVQEIINNLSSTDIDVQFGVASFADFPFYPYGDATAADKAYHLNQPITDNNDAVINAINQLDNPLHYGADLPESQLEALYQCATGAGRDLNSDGDFNDPGELSPTTIGWRTGALKVILLATDAAFHDPEKETYYGATFTETIDALKAKGITVIGLQSGGSSETERDIKRITDATGGAMYALSSDSSQIADKIAAGISEVLKEVKLSIDKISGSEWVTNIIPEVYTGVKPGETRNFSVTLKGQKNATDIDLTYNVYLWVKANDSAIVKRVRIPIIVPRAP